MAAPGGNTYSAKGGDAGPATSASNSAFDSSGWVTNFGPGLPSQLLMGGLLLVGAFVAWKYFRRGR